MKPIVYKSGIDWWVWLCVLFIVAVTVTVIIDSSWIVAIALGGTMLMLLVFMFGCWYTIDGDDLVVYQFFRPNRFPISKIKEVKKTVGYLATAGLSSKRVSIQFSDRSILKSSMPLEISPKDRDGFIAKLKEINSAIIIS